jgi:hypothetical protein
MLYSSGVAGLIKKQVRDILLRHDVNFMSNTDRIETDLIETVYTSPDTSVYNKRMRDKILVLASHETKEIKAEAAALRASRKMLDSSVAQRPQRVLYPNRTGIEPKPDDD